MTKPNKLLLFLFMICCALPAQAREMENMDFVRLRSLDKITARTVTFEAQVGSTVTFGNIFIKVQACRKAPPVEEPESAAFLQIWEDGGEAESEWIFSGWMFASSPGLSHMDHPVYDVWVLDCLTEKSDTPQTDDEEGQDKIVDEDPQEAQDIGEVEETEETTSEPVAPASEDTPEANPAQPAPQE